MSPSLVRKLPFQELIHAKLVAGHVVIPLIGWWSAFKPWMRLSISWTCFGSFIYPGFSRNKKCLFTSYLKESTTRRKWPCGASGGPRQVGLVTGRRTPSWLWISHRHLRRLSALCLLEASPGFEHEPEDSQGYYSWWGGGNRYLKILLDPYWILCRVQWILCRALFINSCFVPRTVSQTWFCAELDPQHPILCRDEIGFFTKSLVPLLCFPSLWWDPRLPKHFVIHVFFTNLIVQRLEWFVPSWDRIKHKTLWPRDRFRSFQTLAIWNSPHSSFQLMVCAEINPG